MIEKKQVLRLTYPENTTVGSLSEFKSRTLIIKGIRDLSRVPLTAREFLRRPLTNRGRWLILARDVERHCFRQFYLASSAEFREVPAPLLRVGLFRNGVLVERLEEFEPTVRERIMASRFVKRVAIHDYGDLTIGVYADDLRVVG